MNILGIETSCDETSLAIVENGTKVHCNMIQSSMNDFTCTGGVIPEQAARKQMEFMPIMLKHILEFDTRFDAIAFTTQPGLQSSLLVGKTTANILAKLYNVPLMPVHHTQGHICSIWLDQTATITYPALCLSLSGGHTELWYKTSVSDGECIGSTQDDAIGEAFDKGATMLGLSYPGGPAIAKCAATGNSKAYTFPLPLKGKDGYNFSYSGLKTSLRTLITTKVTINNSTIADVCASYQHGLCAHIIDRVVKALKHYNVEQIHLVGGVAANTYLRAMLEDSTQLECIYPSTIEYCTDNAAMIASAGYFSLQSA